jgi:hypothetical protein
MTSQLFVSSREMALDVRALRAGGRVRESVYLNVFVYFWNISMGIQTLA